MVKQIKIIIPFLMLFVLAIPASAATFNFSVSGKTNGSNDTKNVYYSYTRGVESIESDDSGYTRYIYDIPFNGYFGTSADRYTSGYFKLNMDITLQSTDLVSVYVEDFDCPVPFTVDQSNLSSGVVSLNFSVYYNDFQHSNTNVPLPSFVLHCVTSSSSIPAIQSLSARSGATYVLVNSTSPVGLENAIADAINNSADVDEMISILSDISDNSALLTSVINKLSDLDVKLSSIITVLNTHTSQNDAENLLLRKLLKALTGEDGSSDITSISGKTRLYWIGIIQEALQLNQDQAEEASSQIENVDGALSKQSSQEAEVFSNYNSAMEDIAFNAVPPANVSGPIGQIVSWLQTIYTKLGVFQYVIIITLTVGIILIVLGRFRVR